MKNKRTYTYKATLIIILCFAISLPNILYSEVLKPFQILLPGNLNGELITFTENQKAECSEAFKLPYVVNDFLKQKDKDSVIFGIGNNSNIFKSFSYLNKGKAEKELIKKCHPLIEALSPNDLEVYNEGYLDYDIKNKVFTNIESFDNNEIFHRFYATTLNNQQIYFFNFISSEYCSKLPLDKWAQIKVDNPARALRKINLDLSQKDYTISVVYGNLETINEITDELKRLKGIHFIINVPINNEAPLFPTTHIADGNQNVFRFSVEPGFNVLPIINVIPKNVGYPRTTLRMIPLKKYKKNSAKNDFKEVWEQYRQNFHEPLKVITTKNRATTSANRIKLQAHAQMIKYATNCEISFLKAPKQISFRESVITVGDCITRFPNERIIRFRATETQLKNMFISMLRDSSIKNFGFAGCKFLSLGNEFWDFKINNNSINKNRLYTVATTESTTNEYAVKKLLKISLTENYDGLTLWNIWINNLRSFPITESYLFE